MRTILYNLTFHRQGAELATALGVVRPVEAPERFYAFHLIDGLRLEPDEDEVEAALIHQHRPAFRRAQWWFPLDLTHPISGIPDPLNAATKMLFSSRGKPIGRVIATPYLANR